MAARNAESTIKTALRSALSQLPRDSEMHVWDDASTDGTLGLLERYPDQRLRVHRSAESVGSGVARAELVARSSSELVANLDADDVWFPGHLRNALNALKSADVVFSSAIKFGKGGLQIRPTRIASLAPNEATTALLVHNPFFHSSMVARRVAIEGAGSYRPLRRGQDYDLWLRLAQQYRLRRIPVASIGYRLSTTQISQGSGYLERVGENSSLSETYLQLMDEVRDRLAEHQAAEEVFRILPNHMSRRNRSYYRKLTEQLGSPVFVRTTEGVRWRGC